MSSENKVVRWVAGLRNPAGLKGLDGYDGGDMEVVFHGAGGPDGYTEKLMERLGKDGIGKSKNSYFYDWSSYSTNLFKAAFNGQAVGRHVGDEIWKGIKGDKAVNVHVVGISVGAFAADAAITRIRKLIDQEGLEGGKVNLQLTLLDPFTQRGVFGVGWGIKNFGKNADYAQQYLNTDDPVPSTNEPCNNCAVFDVTNYGKRDKEIFGHDYPLHHYTQFVDNVGIVKEEERGEMGVVVDVQ